jgi:signal transduction histidine kinase
VSKPLDSAIQGARSAAQLTQRLLAFSRRQALEPVRIDLNRLIVGMLDLLRRTLGERISIETVFAAGVWPVHADAHQLENVLLNLALNAKDATAAASPSRPPTPISTTPMSAASATSLRANIRCCA